MVSRVKVVYFLDSVFSRGDKYYHKMWPRLLQLCAHTVQCAVTAAVAPVMSPLRSHNRIRLGAGRPRYRPTSTHKQMPPCYPCHQFTFEVRHKSCNKALQTWIKCGPDSLSNLLQHDAQDPMKYRQHCLSHSTAFVGRILGAKNV